MTHDASELPLQGTVLRNVCFSAEPGEEYTDDRPVVADINQANVITSYAGTGIVDNDYVRLHKVALDIDVPARLVESSTPGHSHLYIDVEIPEEAYFRLMAAMVECGIVESGYYDASKARGYTALRLPWVNKRVGDVPISKPEVAPGPTEPLHELLTLGAPEDIPARPPLPGGSVIPDDADDWMF